MDQRADTNGTKAVAREGFVVRVGSRALHSFAQLRGTVSARPGTQ